MDRQSVYYQQVQLLLQVLPIVSQHDCFALKGGTAINLFISGIYEGEFRNMAEIDVPKDELEATRVQLIETINRSITEQERQFLLTFKKGTPDWTLLGLTGIEQLPAVRWKLHNLSNMLPSKHAEALAKLRDVLQITT